MPLKYKSEANLLAKSFDSDGGTNTFSVELFNSIGEPVYNWCSAKISKETFEKIKALETNFPGCRIEEWNQDLEPNKPSKLLKDMGLKIRER